MFTHHHPLCGISSRLWLENKGRSLSPGGHKWQKLQSTPLWQPLFVVNHAHGLHSSLLWRVGSRWTLLSSRLQLPPRMDLFGDNLRLDLFGDGGQLRGRPGGQKPCTRRGKWQRSGLLSGPCLKCLWAAALS
ncbi:unnamed protein product, partial [Polarella glacialis]